MSRTVQETSSTAIGNPLRVDLYEPCHDRRGVLAGCRRPFPQGDRVVCDITVSVGGLLVLAKGSHHEGFRSLVVQLQL
jgi:hypothetical protein